jgi:glycosyltransferase involved in cell wall biosynthesis
MAKLFTVSSPQNAAGRAPLISVILPVRNGHPYIADAVSSIQNQTLGEFELLAIDDGSIDGSAGYLKEAAKRDSRIAVIANSNEGLVEALNLGLKIARGEFIARMDADDVAAAIRFQRQIEFLQANPSIAVVGSALTLIDGGGRVIGEVNYPTEPEQVHAALERMDCAVAHGSVMARRAVITSLGGYRPTFRHAEDYDLWLRVAESYRIGDLSERLMCYRCHDDSVSRRREYEQRLATHLALICARERRSWHTEPLIGAANISLSDLLRLDIAESKRAMILHSILQDCRKRPVAQSMRLRVTALLRKMVHQWRKRIAPGPD